MTKVLFPHRVSVNNTTINIDNEAVYNNTSVGVYNQGTLNFGDNLKLSSDTEPTSGIFVNNQSTLNVKGNLTPIFQQKTLKST